MNELSLKRRLKWIKRINRQDFTETKLKYARVFSKHFLTGKPAELLDVAHPDWAPNLLLGYGDDSPSESQSALDRKLRLEHRAEVKKDALPSDTKKEGDMAAEIPVIDQSDIHTVESNDKYCQTDIGAKTFSNMVLSLETTKSREKTLNTFELSFESFRGDNQKTKYYTGLDTFDKFEILVEYTINHVPTHYNVTLPVEQQIILTLMKLRLNLDFSFSWIHISHMPYYSFHIF